MSENKNKENMIYVYDVFTDLYNDDNDNGKFQLTPYLLYMYCLLYRRRNYDKIVETSVDTIHHTANLKFYPSVERTNRKIIKECLLSLRKKGIIHFDESINEELLFTKKGNTIPITITFSRFMENGGYSLVSYSEFDAAYNINYFYIRMAVERYNHVDTLGRYSGRWISENEFGQLLGVSKKTFRSYANDMISKGELFKISGERKESLEQDKNVYRTIPFEGIDSRKIPKDKKYKNGTIFNTVLGELEQWELRELFEASNWRKKDEFGQWLNIEPFDYEVYRVCEDIGICMKKVYECKDSIEKLKFSKQHSENFEKFEEDYLMDKAKL